MSTDAIHCGAQPRRSSTQAQTPIGRPSWQPPASRPHVVPSLALLWLASLAISTTATAYEGSRIDPRNTVDSPPCIAGIPILLSDICKCAGPTPARMLCDTNVVPTRSVVHDLVGFSSLRCIMQLPGAGGGGTALPPARHARLDSRTLVNDGIGVQGQSAHRAVLRRYR